MVVVNVPHSGDGTDIVCAVESVVCCPELDFAVGSRVFFDVSDCLFPPGPSVAQCEFFVYLTQVFYPLVSHFDCVCVKN